MDEKNIARAKEIKKFFKFPTGKKDCSFTTWMKKILEDLLVIDAVAIYKRRNRRNDVIGYLPIDGATIELILDKDGTTPEPPQPAYVQKIGTQDITKLTMDELIYKILNPRTHNPYGLAPLEVLVLTVTTALKLQAYDLGILTEGNVPEGFVEIPKDIASSRDQLKEWQEAWDAMLSGDPRFQRKLKFLPEGMKYSPTRKIEDMSFERFEKWLLLTTCSVFGVAPAALGFTFDVNKASSETTYEVGKERGLFPTALFIKELMDNIIQEDMGHDDMEFSWTNLNPTNKLEEAKVVTSLINSGLMSIDEWRLGENLPPTGARDPFIMTPIGPIFVKDLAKQSDSGQVPIMPYKPVGEAGTTEDANTQALATPNVPNPPKDVSAPPKTAPKKADKIEELRKWRRVALNDIKENKDVRDFKTDIIDFRTQQMIRNGLEMALTKTDIERVFWPFLNEEVKSYQPFLNMYDEINNILSTPQTIKSETAVS